MKRVPLHNTTSSTTHFFETLCPTAIFDDFANREIYTEAPLDWYVAITDVVNSTQAIEQGRYKDVNAVGVASIVGVLNAVHRTEIPFIFGGDGATLLIPGEHLDAVRKTLAAVKLLSQEAFSLHLRAGLIPIRDLKNAGHQLLVGRHATSQHISLAFLAGDGVRTAERWLKDTTLNLAYHVEEEGRSTDLDCTGFECRWEPIPSTKGLIVSLIVEARGQTMIEQNHFYRSLISSLTKEIGSTDRASPATAETLQVGRTLQRYEQEIRIQTKMKSAWKKIAHTGYCGMMALAGSLLPKTGLGHNKFGKRYVQEVLSNTDFRKFDDALRMVIDLEPQQFERLLSLLELHRQKGEIFYGTHTTTSALMTCAVFHRQGQHIHFIDGADGGYSLAARQLKIQRASTPNTHPPT